jgi:carboxypeptidase family protein/TonB-dependent receptor-like protein
MAPRYLVVLVALGLPAALAAQTSASLQGSVSDATGAVVPAATVRVRSQASAIDRSVSTTPDGRYFVVGLPAGRYHVTASATGFRSEVIEELILEVERTVVRDFRLEVGASRETVVVRAEIPLVERGTASVGHAVTPLTVQEIPLNGRRFVDLGLLVPGSVAPSQSGFSTTPIRGLGALAINTAGNREEAVGFHVNGVSTNNLTFGSLIFQPPIGSIQEFRVDNSALGAHHGHVSGAVVSMVTRSGTDAFHGDLFEFFRDDALDARNFFEFTSPDPHPFRRDQFGGSLGGPVIRGRTFFFGTYEGMRQQQGLDLNSLVLSDEQRARVTNPTVRRLAEFIPRPNTVDSGGNPRFVGSGEAVVDTDRWTIDIQQKVGVSGRLHFFYGAQRLHAIEPASQGTTIPGFGHVNRTSASILTLAESHVLGSGLFNEVRFGRSTIDGGIDPSAELDPLSFGIRNGIERPLGLPQFIVAGGLNFGGPGPYPQGRVDASYIVADTLQFLRGRHSMKVGGEYRTFLNENFAEGTGAFNFPSVDAFLAGTANAFSITLGERRNHITQRAVSGFVQDAVRVRSGLTLELGLRYEWHVSPKERDDQFVVFDAATVSLQRVGVDRDGDIYRQNNRNFEPRVGVVWDLGGAGRTVLRAAYAWAVDEPATTAVRDTAANPPFAIPLAASGSIPVSEPLSITRPVGLAPATVDSGFRNASVQSWNVNLQRQVGPNLAASAGYFGSSGRDLRISRNLNQPVNGIRPFPALSPSSSIQPGTPLGNITQVESSGFSSYHALWLSATSRQSHGFQLDASYTWSKSLDTNSLNSSGFAVQDSYDIPNQYGLSDFDARHRFVVSAIYALPLPDRLLTRGWQIAAIVQGQSGNPVNIVTSNSTLNGVPNTVRPDLTGPIRIIGTVEQWFDPSAFTAVDRFGNLGRNVVIGPAYHNTDLSLIKNTPLGGNVHLQLRADVFDLFNHPNFGPPGNIVGSPAFGRITRTRFATGEGGSSRQIQLAAKLAF